MEIKYTKHNNVTYAELISDEVVIRTPQDALDVMMNAIYGGSEHLIWHQHQIHPDFFDLKTGLAGDVLQKFSTYNARLAIIGDFQNIVSKSLTDFVRESNRVGRIVFAENIEQSKSLFLR